MSEYNMRTEEGNFMVERIVNAAVSLLTKREASLLDVEGFVSNNLSRLEKTYPEVLTMPVVKRILFEVVTRSGIDK